QSSAVPWSMLRNVARGACSFIRVSPVAERIAASCLCSQWRICPSISQPAMATDSAALNQQSGIADGRDARSAAPYVPPPARPILQGIGLDQPFFDDKNRAFWVLQSAGWTGYFILRTLSRLANSMGWFYIVHTALLTATGYSITLLMASAFRRLIRMQPVYAWVGTILIVAIAATAFSAIESWSYATFVDLGVRAEGVRLFSAILLTVSVLL